MEIKLIKIDNESYFVYQSSRKVYKERVADIMYFARGGRRVTMQSRESGEIELYCRNLQSTYYRRISLY